MERGRLRVYLGAAPGVGKTYAMLDEGHRRLERGTDVVVGYVEDHGRPRTQAAVNGLEVIGRRRVTYKDTILEEMDLDAVLARHPDVVLVDELAHTNVPGSRHEKRWQDVEEVLAAGIDVYSTLNIQHIESLNDLVARITGVRVQETVPDTVLQMADEIKLIDLPPEDLIQRMREGKVYMPAEAGRALGNFFSRPNLTALRELAMQTAAARVDADRAGVVVRPRGGAVGGRAPALALRPGGADRVPGSGLRAGGALRVRRRAGPRGSGGRGACGVPAAVAGLRERPGGHPVGAPARGPPPGGVHLRAPGHGPAPGHRGGALLPARRGRGSGSLAPRPVTRTGPSVPGPRAADPGHPG